MSLDGLAADQGAPTAMIDMGLKSSLTELEFGFVADQGTGAQSEARKSWLR